MSPGQVVLATRQQPGHEHVKTPHHTSGVYRLYKSSEGLCFWGTTPTPIPPRAGLFSVKPHLPPHLLKQVFSGKPHLTPPPPPSKTGVFWETTPTPTPSKAGVFWETTPTPHHLELPSHHLKQVCVGNHTYPHTV